MNHVYGGCASYKRARAPYGNVVCTRQGTQEPGWPRVNARADCTAACGVRPKRARLNMAAPTMFSWEPQIEKPCSGTVLPASRCAPFPLSPVGQATFGSSSSRNRRKRSRPVQCGSSMQTTCAKKSSSAHETGRCAFKRCVRPRLAACPTQAALPHTLTIVPGAARRLCMISTPLKHSPAPPVSSQDALALVPYNPAQRAAQPPRSYPEMFVEEIDDEGIPINEATVQVDHALPIVPDTSMGEPIPDFFHRPGSPVIEVVSTSPVPPAHHFPAHSSSSLVSSGVCVEEVEEAGEDEPQDRLAAQASSAAAAAAWLDSLGVDGDVTMC